MDRSPPSLSSNPDIGIVQHCAENCSDEILYQLDGNVSLPYSISSSSLSDYDIIHDSCSDVKQTEEIIYQMDGTGTERKHEHTVYDATSLYQLDGNESFKSSHSFTSLPDADLHRVDNSENFQIGVVVGNCPQKKSLCMSRRIPVRKTLKRDNRGQLSLYLPNIAVYNHRSIWKKMNNFCIEFHEMQLGLAFHSEVWEQKENKRQKFKIEEMLQTEDISYISTPRPNRRGGGSALTCDDTLYHLKEIQIDNPDNLEVTFATGRPKDENSP